MVPNDNEGVVTTGIEINRDDEDTQMGFCGVRVFATVGNEQRKVAEDMD